jgi:hypothetical protein
VNGMLLSLLWNPATRTYWAIRKMDETWFPQADLGVDYERARTQLKELNK